MSFIENAVTLADVAKANNMTPAAVKAEALALTLYVGANWAGLPAVDQRDAHALVTGAGRREAENSAANRDHLHAVEAWEAQRMAVHRTAYNAALQEANRAGMGGGQAFSRAQDAAQHAVAEFEAAIPPPSTPAGQSGTWRWFERVKEVVR